MQRKYKQKTALMGRGGDRLKRLRIHAECRCMIVRVLGTVHGEKMVGGEL